MFERRLRNSVFVLMAIGIVLIAAGAAIEFTHYLIGVVLFWGGFCVVLSAGVAEMARKRREKAGDPK